MLLRREGQYAIPCCCCWCCCGGGDLLPPTLLGPAGSSSMVAGAATHGTYEEGLKNGGKNKKLVLCIGLAFVLSGKSILVWC